MSGKRLLGFMGLIKATEKIQIWYTEVLFCVVARNTRFSSSNLSGIKKMSDLDVIEEIAEVFSMAFDKIEFRQKSGYKIERFFLRPSVPAFSRSKKGAIWMSGKKLLS